MRAEIPRLLIAGAGSGSGKTTLSCALLLALKQRGLNQAAFKCGPDYIDPMFHSRVLGLPARNLDIFLSGEAVVKSILGEAAQGRDLALLEGVMGLYDGLGKGDQASSNHLAVLTGTPTLLVLNPRGQSLSLAAQISGYLNFLPNTIKGLLLNQTSARMYDFFKDMLEERLGLRVYGYLPPMPEAGFGSRRLGLITPPEIEDLQRKLAKLAESCERYVDLDGLLALARAASPLEYEPFRNEADGSEAAVDEAGRTTTAGNEPAVAGTGATEATGSEAAHARAGATESTMDEAVGSEAARTGSASTAATVDKTTGSGTTRTGAAVAGAATEAARTKALGAISAGLKIAVAYDRAFCFYYQDNFELLRSLGAELAFFSPLEDAELPAGSCGLLLGGGYPEEHAAALSANSSMRQSIRAAAERALPIFAECGGFMYLGRELSEQSGAVFSMLGLLNSSSRLTGRLGPFGYITLRAERETFLCPKGAEFRAHEFHYSCSDDPGDAFRASKENGANWPCIWASGPGASSPGVSSSGVSDPGVSTLEGRRRIFAGYPHFHFRGNPGLAEGFVRACREYAREAQHG